MPEGPELYLSSLYINRTCGDLVFSGKVVKNPVHKCQDITWNESAYTISAETRGKELMLHLRGCHNSEDIKKSSKNKSECSILFTFGMSGKFEFISADNLPKHSHLTFFTKSEPKMGLAFVDYRRFGKWVEGGQWSNERGPCVIQDHGHFINNVADNLSNNAFNKPICEVLLNQKFFNGIGNYLRAEILFRCKIPPFEKARSVLKMKEPKQEPSAENNTINVNHLIADKKEMKVDLSECPQNEGSNLNVIKSKDIKIEELEESDQTESSVDLFVPKAQELLNLCGSVPREVIDIGSTKYSLSELYKDDSEGKSFNDWLQCYYQEGMKNMVDHNKRTIWFSGPAGPMTPTVQKVRGKKTTKTKKKVAKEEGTADIEQQESSEGHCQDVKTDSHSPSLTRTQLREYKQKTTKATSGKKNKNSDCEKVIIIEKSRKRRTDSPCDKLQKKKVKRTKPIERARVSRRLTRSSVNIEQ